MACGATEEELELVDVEGDEFTGMLVDDTDVEGLVEGDDDALLLVDGLLDVDLEGVLLAPWAEGCAVDAPHPAIRADPIIMITVAPMVLFISASLTYEFDVAGMCIDVMQDITLVTRIGYIIHREELLTFSPTRGGDAAPLDKPRGCRDRLVEALQSSKYR